MTGKLMGYKAEINKAADKGCLVCDWPDL